MSGERKRRVVLSVEQALSMPYATLRFVHLGWRVIRIEPTPAAGRRSPGDPNRYIGRPVADGGRASYYVAPNVGKEAVAIDLKRAEGRALLCRLARELEADVFCTNTMPARHLTLGIDHDTLAAARPGLVWCAISALGAAYPDVPGYDPMMQAMCGYMDLTGLADGAPLQCGPPVIDLKAGDEAFAQVLLALLGERDRRIDISMGQVAVSWLQTFLPMLEMGSPPSDIKRAGNEHRQFIPVNAYPTADGFLYVAIGSDAQWRRLVAEPMFAALDDPRHGTNEGRRAGKAELHAGIGAITRAHPAAAVAEVLARAEVPHAPITPIEQVMELPFVAETLLRTRAPDGRVIRLPPPAAPTPHLAAAGGELPFAPAYGEHTDAILAEVGLGAEAIARLRAEGTVG